MSESYVGKEEFNILVKRVDKMELQNEKNEELLQEVDKKVDIILEKIVNADKQEQLKLAPMEEKINEVKDNQKWLWRSVGGTAIGLIIKYWIG